MSSAQLLPKAIWLTILCLPAVTPSKHGSVTSTDLVTPGAERTSEREREILNVDFDRRRDQAVEIGAAAFSAACTSELLSPAVTSDTLISQTEFANFILNYCISQQVCRRGDQLTYGDLPIALQLAFLNPNCQAPHCNPDTSAAQFGYLYTPATQTAVETSIGQLCDTIYPLAGDFVAATPRPSFTPPIPPTPPSPPVPFVPTPPVPFVPTPPVPFVPTPPSGVTKAPVAPVAPPTGGNQPIPFQPTPFVPTPPTPPTPPVTSAPVTPAPVTSAPVTAAPVTPSPITSAPTTAPPTPVPVAPIAPIPAPVAPIPAPVAPIPAPVAPVPAPVAPVPAPVAPVPAPVAPVPAPVAPVPAPVAPIPVTASPVAPVSAPTGPVAATPIPVAPVAPTPPVQPVTPAPITPITPAPTTTSPSASPSMAQSAGPSASPSQARNPGPAGPPNGGTPPLSLGGIIALSLAGAASAFMLFSLFGAYWFSLLCRRRGTRKAAAAVDDADDAPGGDDAVQHDVEAGNGGGGNGGGASSPVVASREIAPASPEVGGTDNEAEGTGAATPAEAMELQLAPSNSPPLFKTKDTFAWEPSPKAERPNPRNFFGNLFRSGREKTQKKKRENVKFSATVVVEPKAKSSDEAVTASEPDIPLIPELFTPVKTREKEPVKPSEEEPAKPPEEEPAKPPEKEPAKPPEKEPAKPPEKEPIKTAEKEDIPSTEVVETAGQGDSTSTDTDPSTGIEVVSGLSGHIAAGGAVSDDVGPGLVAGAAAGAATVAAVGTAAAVASSKKKKETKKKDKTEKRRWGRKKGQKEDAGAEDDAADDADEPDSESTKKRRRWGRKKKGEKEEAVEETKDEAEDADEGDKASEVSGSPRKRLLGRVRTARRKLKYEAGDDEDEDAAEDTPSKRGVLGRAKKSSGRKLKKSPSLRSAASGDESKDEDEDASEDTGSSSKRGLLGRVRKPSLRKMKKTKSSASLGDSESKAGSSSAATIGEMEGMAGEEGKKSGRKWKGFLRMRNKMGVQLDDEKPMVPPGTIGGEDPGDAMREAVARGDWRRVQDLSMQMEVANVTEGKKPAASLPVSDPKVATDDEQTVGSLRGQLDQAVASSNWSVAEALSAEILSTSAARKAKAKQDAAAEPPSDGPTDQAKIDVINGLIKDGNWKLVSSLSSVYGLDTALEQPVGLEGTTTTGDAASIASGITEDSSGNVEITVKNPYTYTKSMMEPPKLDDQSLSSVSTENQTEKEIERLVANKDWKGLAEFTAQEDEDETDEVDFSVPK